MKGLPCKTTTVNNTVRKCGKRKQITVKMQFHLKKWILPAEFYAGTSDDRRFRYVNAKHEVSEWMEIHGQNGLLELFDNLNDGEDF